MAYGSIETPIPKEAIVSITLGEKQSILKTFINALLSQLVMRQMAKSEGLYYAEITGNLKEGYGFTLSVWNPKSMAPFRSRGSHGIAMRFFSWVFYGGKSEAYFVTYPSGGIIPGREEAIELVRRNGRFYTGGKFVRSATMPPPPVGR